MGAVIPSWLSLLRAAGEAPADIPEGLGAAQLAEGHGHALPPRRETAGVALGLGGLDDLRALQLREELEDLAKDTHAPIHS